MKGKSEPLTAYRLVGLTGAEGRRRRFDAVVVEESLELASEDDLVTQVGARRMQALIAAARGQADEAQARAREAVRIASGSDYVDERVEAFITLGEVLLATGDGDPTESLREALAIAEQKGSTVLAEEARSLLSGRPTPA